MEIDRLHRLNQAITGLESWADDAETAEAAWDGWTQAQKLAAMKIVVQRFGTLCDRMADFLRQMGLE